MQETIDRIHSDRRWWVLSIVSAAQFIFGLDAFIVNVALPTIAADLHASSAQLEAVIAIYFIGYATLVITGGRLGDIYGTRNVFLAGVLGFTATSIWCGLAHSGFELILARLAQGATAALMVPQVLATIHVLFPDQSRGLAFAIYSMALGISAAAGFVLGGVLVTLDPVGLGWRTVFFVNVPAGLMISAAALTLMPSVPRRLGTRLDIPGAMILFVGLLCLIGPLLFGRDLDWGPKVWAIMAAGALVLGGFLLFEFKLAKQGSMPLIDIALLQDPAFMRGLCAVFCFFCANLSFYLVMTLFMQSVLHIDPLRTGLLFLPSAVAFVVAAQHSAIRARQRGTLALTEGCIVQIVGLVALGLTVADLNPPPQWVLVLPLTIFSYGQGFVIAPLSSAVLESVKPGSIGAAAGMYATTTQSANAAGVAAIGAIYFSVLAAGSGPPALLASLVAIAVCIAACIGLLAWMRQAAS
jgi:MFS family permease